MKQQQQQQKQLKNELKKQKHELNKQNKMQQNKARICATDLLAQDPAARSGTLSFLPPEGVDVVPLPEQLAQRGVAVTIPDGCLRLSPHWPNDLAEVPQVVAALREL